MGRVSKVAFEVIGLSIVVFLTMGLLYVFMRRYLNVTPEGTLLPLIPAFILTCMGIGYGYYLRYKHTLEERRRTAFKKIFHLAICSLLIIVPVVLSLYFLLVIQDTSLGILFAIISAVAGMWGMKRIKKYMGVPEE